MVRKKNCSTFSFLFSPPSLSPLCLPHFLIFAFFFFPSLSLLPLSLFPPLSPSPYFLFFFSFSLFLPFSLSSTPLLYIKMHLCYGNIAFATLKIVVTPPPLPALCLSNKGTLDPHSILPCFLWPCHRIS